jgi:hypothetical protein
VIECLNHPLPHPHPTGYTGFHGALEHLNRETRLLDERFAERVSVFFQVSCHNICRLQTVQDFQYFFCPDGIKREDSLKQLGVKRPANHTGEFKPFEHLYASCGFKKTDFQNGFMVNTTSKKSSQHAPRRCLLLVYVCDLTVSTRRR